MAPLKGGWDLELTESVSFVICCFIQWPCTVTVLWMSRARSVHLLCVILHDLHIILHGLRLHFCPLHLNWMFYWRRTADAKAHFQEWHISSDQGETVICGFSRHDNKYPPHRIRCLGFAPLSVFVFLFLSRSHFLALAGPLPGHRDAKHWLECLSYPRANPEWPTGQKLDPSECVL